VHRNETGAPKTQATTSSERNNGHNKQNNQLKTTICKTGTLSAYCNNKRSQRRQRKHQGWPPTAVNIRPAPADNAGDGPKDNGVPTPDQASARFGRLFI